MFILTQRTLLPILQKSIQGDEALPGSDVDVLVEFANPTFDNYMDLKFYLEDLFQTPVDLVIADTLKPRIIPHIINEIVYA